MALFLLAVRQPFLRGLQAVIHGVAEEMDQRLGKGAVNLRGDPYPVVLHLHRGQFLFQPLGQPHRRFGVPGEQLAQGDIAQALDPAQHLPGLFGIQARPSLQQPVGQTLQHLGLLRGQGEMAPPGKEGVAQSFLEHGQFLRQGLIGQGLFFFQHTPVRLLLGQVAAQPVEGGFVLMETARQVKELQLAEKPLEGMHLAINLGQTSGQFLIRGSEQPGQGAVAELVVIVKHLEQFGRFGGRGHDEAQAGLLFRPPGLKAALLGDIGDDQHQPLRAQQAVGDIQVTIVKKQLLGHQREQDVALEFVGGLHDPLDIGAETVPFLLILGKEQGSHGFPGHLLAEKCHAFPAVFRFHRQIRAKGKKALARVVEQPGQTVALVGQLAAGDENAPVHGGDEKGDQQHHRGNGQQDVDELPGAFLRSL